MLLERAGCDESAISHSRTVKKIAEELAKVFVADIRLVVAGAMLHDIGKAKDDTLMHANIGADMAEELSLPEDLVSIIRKHIGAGIDDKDASERGLPDFDYIPRTIEEMIVAQSNNMVCGDKIVNHSHSVEKFKATGLHRSAERIEAMHRTLSERYGKDLDEKAASLFSE